MLTPVSWRRRTGDWPPTRRRSPSWKTRSQLHGGRQQLARHARLRRGRPPPATCSSTSCWPRPGGRWMRSATASISVTAPNAEGKGFVDYVLWGADGLPLAVVEAKRTSKSPEVGQQQAKLYADCLERQFGRRPVIFYTNGADEHRIWDDAGGYPPRETQGFYTRDELDLLIQRRQTKLALSSALSGTTNIAGPALPGASNQGRGRCVRPQAARGPPRHGNRLGKTLHHHRARRSAAEGELVKRVLFLADRTALVNQAANAFKQHLPGSTTVNLGHERCYRGTGLRLDVPHDDEPHQRDRRRHSSLRAGYFDLIVIDEAPPLLVRQVRRDLLDYFDSLPHRPHRDTKGRGRPQHLPAVPPRRRRTH